MSSDADLAQGVAPLKRAVRILVVEDDPISLEIVAAYLRRIGLADFELHSATSAAQGLALLDQTNMDLVISDLFLPDSEGVDTVEKLVQAVSCPVIAITSSRDPSLREAILARGAFDFVHKSDLTEPTLMRLVRLAMLQARTFRALRYQEQVAQFGQAALVKCALAELIAKAARAIREGLDAEAVAYLDSKPTMRKLATRAFVISAAETYRYASRCAPGEPALQVMRSGNRALTHGAQLSLPWARNLHVALVGVRGDAGVRGVLCVCFRDAQGFGADELNFVEAMASVLSTALQRIDSERRLAYLAQFDPVTGLPNRALLADRFAHTIVQARRRATPLAVLFVDLDDFKLVNDTLGHAGGDALLKLIGARLRAALRSGDTVARISGDEFALLIADLERPEDAALVAQKIIDSIARPFTVQGQEVLLTASVGIAVSPADGADAETLLGAADAAMYRAKQSGRNGYQFFTTEINQRSRARAQLSSELRRGLEREEFALAYQPKFELATRRWSGVEALLRWKHPARGTVSPAEFIPVLEETGLIVPVGEWVLRRACEDLKALRAAGRAVGSVSVNLSARQFRQPDLDRRIKALVAAVGLAPELLELEITESQLMHDPDHAIRVMGSLREAGMRIAIDDFGTGYSSLAYLRRFPVTSLKIDRAFIKDLSTAKGDETIVRTIIEMARSLGFIVIAEGVETEAQATFLRLLRCEQAQGYLFGAPMSADEVAARLARPSALLAPAANVVQLR